MLPIITYYQIKQVDKEDQDKELKAEIQAIYDEHKGNYGYLMNHKKVQRLMKGMKIVARIRQKHQYSSYKGEVGKKADNRFSVSLKVLSLIKSVI